MSVFDSPFNQVFRNPFGTPFNGEATGVWSPALWFMSSEQGIWLDPSDMSTMFQDSAGTIPVTAVEQPVGLALDKRRGLVRGPELVANGEFTSGASWTLNDASVTISGGALRFTATPTLKYAQQAIAGTTEKFCEVTVVVSSITSGELNVQFDGGAGASISSMTTAGTYVFRFRQQAGFSSFFIQNVGTTTAVVESVSIKEIAGNHASQPTTAQKPVLSARKNLLPNSVRGATPGGGSNTLTFDQLGPTGLYDATKTNENAANSQHVTSLGVIASVAGAVQTYSVAIKAAERTWVRIQTSDGAANRFAYFDVANGVAGSADAGLTTSIAPHPSGGGWYVCSITRTSAGTGGGMGVLCALSGSVDSYVGVAGNGVLVAHPQVEFGSSRGTYQWTSSATDYDTVGFPHYGKFDRVDDNMTAAAGGGGTTGICVCAAIRAGGAGNARTIFSDRGTNTGYRLSINASNQLVLSAGNGSAHTEVVGPTITAGTDYVVTGWHDGVNLNVQVNAGAATSAAFGAATAGTASFTIGKDNGAASGYYGERIYEIVYRKDDASSAGDRTSLITYMAEQAGISL